MSWKVVGRFINRKMGRSYNAVGRPAYPVLKMFKIMLLQSWHNLSDREVSAALFDWISFHKFAGFSFELDTPSYSTLCRFRNNFIRAGLDVILFNLVNRYLEMVGLITKEGIIVDSSIIQSSRKPRKIVDVTENKHAVVYSGDRDAKWTIKADRPYYGYKLHMATDLNYGFIVGGKITFANRADTKEIIPLIEKASLKKGAIILADKGYCSTRNREYILSFGYIPVIMYRAHKGKPLTKLKNGMNSIISPIRGTVERTFGTLKRGYEFYRTKYLGIAKTRWQFIISALALNLKKPSNFLVNC